MKQSWRLSTTKNTRVQKFLAKKKLTETFEIALRFSNVSQIDRAVHFILDGHRLVRKIPQLRTGCNFTYWMSFTGKNVFLKNNFLAQQSSGHRSFANFICYFSVHFIAGSNFFFSRENQSCLLVNSLKICNRKRSVDTHFWRPICCRKFGPKQKCFARLPNPQTK